MDMQLRASDILEIVEEIEERRLQFYSCLGRFSRSPAVRLICRQFVTRSRNLADTIMQWRTRSSGTPSASASGEAESRHHQAMVSLAFFTGDHSEAYSMSHQASGNRRPNNERRYQKIGTSSCVLRRPERVRTRVGCHRSN